MGRFRGKGFRPAAQVQYQHQQQSVLADNGMNLSSNPLSNGVKVSIFNDHPHAPVRSNPSLVHQQVAPPAVHRWAHDLFGDGPAPTSSSTTGGMIRIQNLHFNVSYTTESMAAMKRFLYICYIYLHNQPLDETKPYQTATYIKHSNRFPKKTSKNSPLVTAPSPKLKSTTTMSKDRKEQHPSNLSTNKMLKPPSMICMVCPWMAWCWTCGIRICHRQGRCRAGSNSLRKYGHRARFQQQPHLKHKLDQNFLGKRHMEEGTLRPLVSETAIKK
jgi:hypothetical protein